MAPGYADTMAILVDQSERQAETIRNLRALCVAWAIPDDRIAEAQKPLVMDQGPKQHHDGHTEPMEVDDGHEIALIREADRDVPAGHRTVELPTLARKLGVI